MSMVSGEHPKMIDILLHKIGINFHLQQVFHSIYFHFVLPDVFLLCVCAVMVFIVCFSSAAAISILLIVTLCVFW